MVAGRLPTGKNRNDPELQTSHTPRTLCPCLVPLFARFSLLPGSGTCTARPRAAECLQLPTRELEVAAEFREAGRATKSSRTCPARRSSLNMTRTRVPYSGRPFEPCAQPLEFDNYKARKAQERPLLLAYLHRCHRAVVRLSACCQPLLGGWDYLKRVPPQTRALALVRALLVLQPLELNHQYLPVPHHPTSLLLRALSAILRSLFYFVFFKRPCQVHLCRPLVVLGTPSASFYTWGNAGWQRCPQFSRQGFDAAAL